MAKDKPDKTMTEKSTTDEGKLKALNLAMEHIEKQFGKGSIMKLGEGNAYAQVEVKIGRAHV